MAGRPKNVSNMFKPSSNRAFSEGMKSKGILDDYAERKNIDTYSGTVQKVPFNDSDIANKKYVDDNLSASGVNSINGETGVVILDTDNVLEGTTNSYSPWNKTILGLSYMDDNVGIGTTNPTVKFSINNNGGTDFTQLWHSSISDMAIGISADSPLISGMDFKNFDSHGQVRLMARTSDNAYITMNAMGSTAGAQFFGQAGNQLSMFGFGKRVSVGTFSYNPLILGTNNQERMRLDENGNIGIGIATPSEKLDVVGNIAVSGTVDGIDIAATAHTHDNKTTLDKFGENASGLPTYNGNQVDTTIAQRDVYDGLDSTDNTISLSAKQGKTLKDVQDTQTTAIALNTAKTGITTTQASAITTNTAKTTNQTLFKKSNSTFTDNDTSQTFPDTFVDADSLVVVSLTSATDAAGTWSVTSAAGSFTITSTSAESTDITFDYFVTKSI